MQLLKNPKSATYKLSLPKYLMLENSAGMYMCYYLACVAIATAAMEMLAGDVGIKMSRKPEIMADAAYAIFLHTCDQLTGKFLIDDDVVKKAGITDLEQYANSPGNYVNHVTIQLMLVFVRCVCVYHFQVHCPISKSTCTCVQMKRNMEYCFCQN